MIFGKFKCTGFTKSGTGAGDANDFVHAELFFVLNFFLEEYKNSLLNELFNAENLLWEEYKDSLLNELFIAEKFLWNEHTNSFLLIYLLLENLYILKFSNLQISFRL